MAFMKNEMLKTYRNYHLSTNKRLHIFIWAAFFIAILLSTLSRGTSSYRSGGMMLACGCVVSFVLPLYYFRHVFWKRSSEMYFALPITRKTLFKELFLNVLKTGLIPLIVIYITDIGFSTIMHTPNLYYQAFLPLQSFLILLLALPMFVVISAIVTWVISFANHLLDAILLSFACLFVPIIAFGCFQSFINMQVSQILIGMSSTSEFLSTVHFPCFLSPVYCLKTIAEFLLIQKNSINMIVLVSYFIWLIIGGIALYYGYANYQKRPQENSEDRTKVWYGYPLWIHIFVFAVMLMTINSNQIVSSLFTVFVILLVYIGMMFIAQRKMRFRSKHFICFGTIAILVLGFSYIFTATNGFYTIREIIPSDSYKFMELSIDYMYTYDKVDTNNIENYPNMKVATGKEQAGKPIEVAARKVSLIISDPKIMKEIEELQKKTVDKAIDLRVLNYRMTNKGYGDVFIGYSKKEPSNINNVDVDRTYSLKAEDINAIYQEFILDISKERPKGVQIEFISIN